MDEQEYSTLQTLTNIDTFREDKKTTWQYHLLFVIGLVLAVLLDQWTKHLAVVRLKEQHRVTVVVWDKILQLTYVENRGAAWGVMQGKSVVFLVIGIVILILIGFLYRNMPFSKKYIPMRLIALFLAAGAVGNMIDRVRQGYVVDFFEFGFMDFPVFNVADVYVTVSAVLLILLGLFFYKDEDFEVLAGKKKLEEG